MGDDGDEARKRMQVKSFTTWVNLHVSKVGMEVKNLTKDFEDGIRLIKLIEVISEESLGKYNPAPKNKFILVIYFIFIFFHLQKATEREVYN